MKTEEKDSLKCIVNKSKIADRIKQRGISKSIIEKWRFFQKPFLILVFLYTFGIIAILRADFNYIDDMGRVATGYRGWENFSRYLSSFLSVFLHADKYLTDVSPLPQLIAIMLLALSGVIVLYVLLGQKKYTWGELIALIPLGLSPYFLECISYKYDAPYMALSVLASVCPLLLYNCNWLFYSCAVAAGTLVMCMTYQASSGIYPMLVVLLCMRKWS